MNSSIIMVVVTAVVISANIGLSSSDVFSSLMKIQRMVDEERNLLTRLNEFVDRQLTNLVQLSDFYTDRLNTFKRAKAESDFLHPNHVIMALVNFVFSYKKALNSHYDTFSSSVGNSKQLLMADDEDIKRAIRALLRIQSVYDLRALDMAKGDYLGYQGPQLNYFVSYIIGEIAISVKKFNESIEWLNTTVILYSENDVEKLYPNITLDAIKGLMGQAYLAIGNINRAEELYKEAEKSNSFDRNVFMLRKALRDPPQVRLKSQPTQEHFQNYSQLCKLDKERYKWKPISPLLICRHRHTDLRYYRFQEEIVSVSPFISLIYNVISDAEGAHIKFVVSDKLVTDQPKIIKMRRHYTRTGHVGVVNIDESRVAAAISSRIGSITGLETDQRLSGRSKPGDAIQVINYGLGGHSEVHMDPPETKSASSAEKLHHSGVKMATFQIYLSDVEKGGSTVFTRAGISVAPVKNMALMWFNFDPALQLDVQTHHGECPVLFGQNWVMTKWISSNGNMFRRRCGLKPDVTQLDIESDIMRGYH